MQTKRDTSSSGPAHDSSLEDERVREEMGKEVPPRDTQYGIGRWTPQSLQRFSTLWSFVGLYTPCAIFKVSITQYTRTQVSAIEDHFHINSSKAGILISAVDIGSVAFALIGAHFGRFAHIPRLLAFSAVVAGLSVMAISVVQMAEPRSLPSDPSDLRFGSINSREEQKLLNELCWTQATAERFRLPFNISENFGELENFIHLYRDENYDNLSESLSWTYFWTIGALIVAGAVMSYKLALQTYYIEHNVQDARHSGKYIGVLQAAMVFGSPLALFLAAFIHSIPVDIESTNMRTSDPRWVSAWWLGYVIIGTFLVLLSIPVFPLPRRIALSRDVDEETSSCESDNVLGAQNLQTPQCSRRPCQQGPLTNEPLLQNNGRSRPAGYLSNATIELGDGQPKQSSHYMSDDESFRTLYDKVDSGQRRYLSCHDLHSQNDLQVELKHLNDLLHSSSPTSDHKPTKQHKDIHDTGVKASYLNGSICSKPPVSTHQRNGSSPRVSPCHGDRHQEPLASNPQPQDNPGVGLNQKLKSWPESFRRLIRNPVILLMILEGGFFYVGLLGVLAFQLKYIEDQFDESASKINLFLGIGQLSTAVAGTYLGGYLTTKFSLTRTEMFKASLASQVTALILSSSFVFLGCDNHDIIGLTQDIRSGHRDECLCANNSILLICGSDGRNYLSPCVAGCQDIDDLDFRNCSYIQGKGTASPGFCDNNCHTFYPLLLIYVFLVFVATLGLAPRTLMVCRSVALEDESLANGLVNGFVLRCAAIGGPILFGNLYDDTCLLWPHGNGSCKVVDKHDLRTHFQGTGLILRAVGTLFMLTATVYVTLEDRAHQKTVQDTQNPRDDRD